MKWKIMVFYSESAWYNEIDLYTALVEGGLVQEGEETGLTTLRAEGWRCCWREYKVNFATYMIKKTLET